jgi:homogentisate 1,2-dioxygenase
LKLFTQTKSWLYRIRPSVCHKPFQKIEKGNLENDFAKCAPNPAQIRWAPFEIPKDKEVDFTQGNHFPTNSN